MSGNTVARACFPYFSPYARLLQRQLATIPREQALVSKPTTAAASFGALAFLTPGRLNCRKITGLWLCVDLIDPHGTDNSMDHGESLDAGLGYHMLIE